MKKQDNKINAKQNAISVLSFNEFMKLGRGKEPTRKSTTPTLDKLTKEEKKDLFGILFPEEFEDD